MNMKRIFLLTVLSVLATSCIVAPPPNPGFRVETQIEVRTGTFPFQADIPVNKPGTVTDGEFVRVLPAQEPITGTEEPFTRKTSNSAGYFDVPNGKTPATWTAQAISGWSLPSPTSTTDCNGRGTAFVALAGEITVLRCEILEGFGFPFAPSVVSNNSAFPSELRATIPNVSTDYGMPVFHFEDYNGTVVGVATATTVQNGANVTVSPSCIRGKPVGRYTVKVYNAVPSGTASGKPIGNSTITVSNSPCPGMENQIQSCYNSGFRWDWTHCYCTQIR